MRRIVSLALALALAAGPLAAQDRAPRDSTRADSTRADSTRADTLRRLAHPVDATAALVVPVALFAAPVLAFVPAPFAAFGPKGPSEMMFMRDHEAWYASVGGRFSKGQTWANSLNFESVRNDVHTELLVEDYWRPQHVRYFNLRGGWLWHPTRFAAGGVTLGYVHSDGDLSQRGPELGVPLYCGNADLNLRLEPTYVASPDGALWSYRLQVEGTLVPNSPFFVGASATWKSLTLSSDSRHDFAAQAFSILVGSRLP
jgi:hypothetical protein